MFRKEFAEVISKTGMVPLKDIRPLLQNTKENEISEFELLELGFFDDIKFAKVVAEHYGLKFIELNKLKIRSDKLKLMRRKDIVKFRCIPIARDANVTTMAIFDPSIINIKGDVIKVVQHGVNFVIASIGDWMRLFDSIEESVEEILNSIEEVSTDHVTQTDVQIEDIGDDIIYYVNRILASAYLKGASDIHIEPYEKIFRVRFRIDGKLVEIERPNRSLMLPIISRLKIMAQMDISEKRKPQDGRIKLRIAESPIDYRVSSLPTLFGEKMVLRLLDNSNLELDMKKLGLENKQLEVLMDGIYRPFGMCLVTGPTGSGKTTTLYSAITELNKITSNISTAEDPVEFNLEGINQVNVKPDIGFDFSTALRAFLRQDPDIIMVGEIRDYETAEIAVEAALTGHLVLSTLHTNDAASTIVRLLNMGVEPFLVTGSLNVVVAQRLLRKICIHCKEVDKNVTKEKLIAVGFGENTAQKIVVYKGKGCERCSNTGYKGRVGIYEVLKVTQLIRDLILQNKSADHIKRAAIAEGMKSLRMSALTKVAQGMTTLEEALINSASDK